MSLRKTRLATPRHERLIDRVNGWLAAFQAIAVVLGVIVALYQLHQISAQTELQSQSLKTTQAAQSAALVLQLKNLLEADKYKKITTAIQEHDQKHKLLGGAFRDTEVEDYIGNLEDIGLLVKESPLLMGYGLQSFLVRCREGVVQSGCSEGDRQCPEGGQERHGLGRRHIRGVREACAIVPR
jgi:hypothetical protein